MEFILKRLLNSDSVPELGEKCVNKLSLSQSYVIDIIRNYANLKNYLTRIVLNNLIEIFSQALCRTDSERSFSNFTSILELRVYYESKSQLNSTLESH